MNKIYIKILFCSFLYITSLSAYAQDRPISGQVADAENGETLPGVSIYVKGNSSIGTSTDIDGKYILNVSENATLVFSFIGYKVEEFPVAGLSTLNVVMGIEGTTLTNVVVIGSRNANRSATDTPVPVDVLDMQSLNISAPQVNINQILNYVAPSFTSTTQTVADGTDHIDPASLRGLGPDQILVLINGKRRHSSSLVNINSSAGRGSVGTDLNAIPTHAIKRIEVLRDGAAAQYGSDAIAGVINIVLKDQHKGLDLSVTGGSNLSKNGNNFDGGMDGEDVQLNANYGVPIGKKGGFINFTGSAYIRAAASRAKGFSGSIYNGYNAIEWEASKDGFDLDALRTDPDNIKNYAQTVSHFSNDLKQDINNAADIEALRGMLGENVTDAELGARELTRKDFSMKVGQSALRAGKFFINASIPLTDKFEFYSFGGSSYRKGIAAGFYRRPDQSRANTAAYINGFLPHIHSDVNDQSIAVGFRGITRGWNMDFSNTWGQNSFLFSIENSSNATLGKDTNTSFNAGGFSFSQNTTNLDISRFYSDVWEGLNVAFGGEYRVENYKLLAGEEASYASYYNDGTVSTIPDPNKTVVDFFNRTRPGGAQVFPGYKPVNERDEYRNSVAAYVDVEADISRSVLVSAATRFENYSDFGSTINFKLASRWKILENLALRVAGNTGFRAPSLHQLHFNATSTNFIQGIPYEVGTFSNDSRIAKLLGIESLKNETSMSASGGVMWSIPSIGMKITVDGYYTRINDRATLTGTFSKPVTVEPENVTKDNPALTPAQEELQGLFDQANATKARFFANSIDTESMGMDAVITQSSEFRKGFSLTNSLALSIFSNKQIGDIHSSEALADAGLTSTYFGQRDRAFLETALPRTKANLSHDLKIDKWSFFLRNAYFGEVTNPDLVDGNEVTFAGKILTDLSVGYSFSTHINFVIGVNNVLDVYPDEAPASLTSGSQFVFPRTTSQFGANGRYMFARLNISI